MLVNARLIALAALATLVAGQTPDACITSCSQGALKNVTNKSCTSYANPCVCKDAGFQNAANQCLQKNCTAADLQTAQALQKVLCGNTTTNSTTSASASGSKSATSEVYSSTTASGSASAKSGSSTASGSGSPSGSSSSSASGSAASASQSSSSAFAPTQAGQSGLFALGVAAAGAIVGGLLI